MSADDWQRLGSLVTILVAVGWGAVQAKAGRKKAEVAVGHAEQAVLNTAPISNGFVSRIDAKLDRLLLEQAEFRGEVNARFEEHDKRHDREAVTRLRRAR